MIHDTMETDRLILRGATADDLDDFYRYARKPGIGPAAGWKPHESREESLQILTSFIWGDNAEWMIVEKCSGALIGSIGLQTDFKRSLGMDEVRNLGYVLDDIAWGKGYATEAARAVLRYAFEEMCLLLVTAQHSTFNEASKRVIKKCGFRYEGTLRMVTKQFDGNLYDKACYSLTHQEYRMQCDGQDRD